MLQTGIGKRQRKSKLVKIVLARMLQERSADREKVEKQKATTMKTINYCSRYRPVWKGKDLVKSLSMHKLHEC